jgi:chemotaxis protein MotB
MARQRKKPPEDNELRWLTTYGDVVTLLLAFFVMLYAISQVDVQKFQLFVTGLADPFGNPAVSEGLLTDGAALVGAAAVAEQQVGEEGVQGLALLDGMPGIEDQQAGEATEPQDEAPPGEELMPADDLQQVREEIIAALEDAGFGERVVDFEIDARGLIVAIATDNVLFASGSADFGSEGREIIAAVAPILSGFSNEILVEGHTDTVPINRVGYDNWNLSADRALAVLKLLVTGFGLDPHRLVAAGYGEFRPRASNDTDEGKAKNRRVELVIVAREGDSHGT